MHYWADLQSVHGLRCCGNITLTRNVSKYMFVLALCLVLDNISKFVNIHISSEVIINNNSNSLISCYEYVSLCRIVSYGALTEKPADTTLLPSGSLRLNCSSNLTDDAGDPIPIAWVFTEEGSQTSQSMTIDGGLTQDFRGSFTIDSSNKYDLKATLTNETDRYCGTYKCVDNNGAGDESASAAVAS